MDREAHALQQADVEIWERVILLVVEGQVPKKMLVTMANNAR